MEKNLNPSTLSQFFLSFFFHNFPRKLVALFSAIIIWFLVNHTLTTTRTLLHVPVRVIHVAPNKTVLGGQSHGILDKKIALTLRGKKSALENLSQNDVEILINAAGKEESFIAKIDKKNLYLLSHDEQLKKNITEISAPDIFIKISDLVTEEIPLTITTPMGEPPAGFHYVDIFPKQLVQKVTGPKEEVLALKQQGLKLSFDLDKIQESDLENVLSKDQDEITFIVPPAWRKVAIPFKNGALENLNDPRSDHLRIELLKKEHLLLEVRLPIAIFYSAKKLPSFNPREITLSPSPLVQWSHKVPLLNLPVYVGGVSRHFLEIVQDKLQIALFLKEDETLGWSLVFIDEKALEEAFVEGFQQGNKSTEESLRKRFYHYLHSLALFTQEGEPFQFKAILEANQIKLSL